MSRKPGPHSVRDSITIALRIPKAMHEGICKACGISSLEDWKKIFPEWGRNALRAAVSKGKTTLAGAQLDGYDEGWKAGWAHANRVFREALTKALGKLKEE